MTRTALPENTWKLDLADLTKGMHGLSPTSGACLAEAGGVCFEHNGHSASTMIELDGEQKTVAEITWPILDYRAKSSWGDIQAATEHGAYGVAFVVVKRISGWEVLEKSRKGTGFDYWVGEKDDKAKLGFIRRARLEVSGIIKGLSSDITQRMKQKLKQVSVSDGSYPAYIAIVEFGKPRAKVVKKC